MDDPVTTAAVSAGIKALPGWADDFQYKNVGGECPRCHHGPLYERHVGFVIPELCTPPKSVLAG